MDKNSDELIFIVEDKSIVANKRMMREKSSYFEKMFQDHFVEDKKSEIKLHSVKSDHFQMLVDCMKSQTLSSDIEQYSVDTVLDLLECADMFQCDSVQRACSHHLCRSLSQDNCWTLFKVGTMVSDTNLSISSENYILWHFKQTLASTDFLSTPLELISKILSSPYLNVSQELDQSTLDHLIHWCSSNKTEVSSLIQNSSLNGTKDEKKLTDKELLVELFRRTERKLPIVPCVVGFTVKGGMKRAKLFCWDQRTRNVKMLDCDLGFDRQNDVEAKGFNISSHGITLVMSGGEYALGASNWQRGLLAWDSLQPGSCWRTLASLDTVRRHHAAVISDDGKSVYLVGGFGRHRVMLDSVVRAELATGEQRDCAALDTPLYSPALDTWRDGKLIAVGRRKVSVYSPDTDCWRPLHADTFPSDIEFDRGLHDAASHSLYLTSRLSCSLYQLTQDEAKPGDTCQIRHVGKFSAEAQNTCLVAQDRRIYNFSSDEFGDNRSVEVFHIDSETFETVWSQDVPEWDFSSQYSLGCFPLVHYDFK